MSFATAGEDSAQGVFNMPDGQTSLQLVNRPTAPLSSICRPLLSLVIFSYAPLLRAVLTLQPGQRWVPREPR